MLAMPFSDGTFDLVVSSMAIHNIDDQDICSHRRRLQGHDEAVRVLKPGGRLLIADFWSSAYADHLRSHGMSDVRDRSLGWRFWYLPGIGARLALSPAECVVSDRTRRTTPRISTPQNARIMSPPSPMPRPHSQPLPFGAV
jgi:SAM-dependent methyltransferase